VASAARAFILIDLVRRGAMKHKILYSFLFSFVPYREHPKIVLDLLSIVTNIYGGASSLRAICKYGF